MNPEIVKEKQYLEKAVKTDLPWGPLFAKSENFKWGYFVEEGKLIAKYLNRPSDILIIGSGNGREAYPICRDAHRIFCIDIGMLYLQSGKRLFSAEGCTNVRFVAADMYHLPFAESSFDFIFFSMFTAAREERFDMPMCIHRLLRPGGLVLISAITSLHPASYRYHTVETVDDLRWEQSRSPFEVLEGAVDPKRPDYLFAILKAIDFDG